MLFGSRRILRSGMTTLTLAIAAMCAAAAQSNTVAPPANPQVPASIPNQVSPSASQAPGSQSTPDAAPQDQTPQNQAPSAQPLGPEPGDDPGRFVFKKEVEEVVLHATVADQQGHLITSLDRSAFSITQNGVSQLITSFHREDVPVAIGIVIDNSGSMRDKREKVAQAVLNLIRASNPQDEVFVVNFGQTPYLDQDFTADVNLLQAAMHQTSTHGSTALYDAVVASSVHLRNNPRLEKKVLLVITDGEDNMSRNTLQDAMRQLQPSKGPTVYTIGLTNEGFTRNGREALQDLATATGGVAFFPQSPDDVNSITRSIAHDIRSQYTLAYKGGNKKNGYQAIKVEAHAPGYGELVVRTRSGFYPGEKMR
jgi:Ca-activated chloride channel homolog